MVRGSSSTRVLYACDFVHRIREKYLVYSASTPRCIWVKPKWMYTTFLIFCFSFSFFLSLVVTRWELMIYGYVVCGRKHWSLRLSHRRIQVRRTWQHPTSTFFKLTFWDLILWQMLPFILKSLNCFLFFKGQQTQSSTTSTF